LAGLVCGRRRKPPVHGDSPTVSRRSVFLELSGCREVAAEGRITSDRIPTMKTRLLLSLAFLALVLSACGPIRSTAGLVKADQALAAARDAQAEKHAAYPLMLAQSLRDKAWEEQGYGEYDTATSLAKEAEMFAIEAISATKRAMAAEEPSTDWFSSESGAVSEEEDKEGDGLVPEGMDTAESPEGAAPSQKDEVGSPASSEDTP
jgi:hypothetical protein